MPLNFAVLKVCFLSARIDLRLSVRSVETSTSPITRSSLVRDCGKLQLTKGRKTCREVHQFKRSSFPTVHYCAHDSEKCTSNVERLQKVLKVWPVTPTESARIVRVFRNVSCVFTKGENWHILRLENGPLGLPVCPVTSASIIQTMRQRWNRFLLGNFSVASQVCCCCASADWTFSFCDSSSSIAQTSL